MNRKYVKQEDGTHKIIGVSFLRANVSHYSFVTALTTGGSVDLNVILNANVHEGVRVKDPQMFSAFEEAPYHNILQGAVFQCCDLLTFISGAYDSKKLLENDFPEGFGQPTEFTIETWEAEEDNLYEWQLKSKTHWGGVKWLDAAHTGDGGDRCCAGIATFTCKSKDVENVENGEIVKVPETETHPNYELRRILQRNMVGPKHPANYMG